MYAIGVGAVFWRRNVHSSHPNALAICDEHVKPLAVGGSDAFHKSMSDAIEFQILGEGEKKSENFWGPVFRRKYR